MDEVSGIEFEDFFHLLGTPIPLMYHENEGMIVVRVGGLLVICSDEDNEKYVLEPGTTIEDIANAVANGVHNTLQYTELTYESMQTFLIERLELMWQWEWSEFGRNRWQELADRGGEVDASWLTNKPARGDWWYFEIKPSKFS